MDINFNSACCEKDFSSQPPLNGVQISVECCDCDLKADIGNNLRVHLLIKHVKLNFYTVVPDIGKLDNHKPKVTNGKIASIHVMMAKNT